ncbi:MAG: hypothetical protein GC160_19135 [Acidobacteria bacterium]|nr:hypothetical protein [Acidobacteriota bacterium]
MEEAEHSDDQWSQTVAAELPKIWIGYSTAAIATVVFVYGVAVTPGAEFDPNVLPLWVSFASLGAFCYWLWCVKKIHDAIDMVEGYRHPISAGKAVAWHFIPIFNIYWVFRWPSAIARFVNWRTQRKAMRGWVAGVLTLAAFLLRSLLGPIGLFFLFGAASYVSRAIRRSLLAPPVPPDAMAPPGWKGPLGLTE